MPASKAQQAATAERRKKAIALAIAGLDWQAIADKLGYASKGAAHTDVKRAMEHNLAELKMKAEEYRELELLRLERLRAAVWPKALKGDPKAIGAALQISDRTVKLLRLDRLEADGTADARSMLTELGRAITGLVQDADKNGEG